MGRLAFDFWEGDVDPNEAMGDDDAWARAMDLADPDVPFSLEEAALTYMIDEGEEDIMDEEPGEDLETWDSDEDPPAYVPVDA